MYTSGEHHIGKLELGDNESIYIGKNAVLYANIFAVGKKNIRVFGHGILNGSDEIRTEKNGDIGWDGETSFSKEKLHTLGCLRLIDCKDIIIDGITITDSSSYAASIYASDNININNVKVVGHWKYNNDGIDLFNCSNAVISNSFIRSFDDTICIKGISAFSDKNCENIHVNNCILWCGWGKTLEIGVATAAREIKNITFENCNLIHNQHICISIANGQFAQISDVYYKNLNIEYEYVDCGMYQTDDAMAFEHSKRQLPTLISISDGRRNWQGNIASDSESRSIRNVVFDNINLICDDDIMPQVCLRRYNEVGVFDNIIIGTLRKNGKSLMENVDVTNGIQ